MNSNQLNFEFCDWREAFRRFYEEKKKDSSICLIVERGEYVSGYWIEHYSENTKTETCEIYRSVKAVEELEKRVNDVIEGSRARHLSNEPSMSVGLVL